MHPFFLYSIKQAKRARKASGEWSLEGPEVKQPDGKVCSYNILAQVFTPAT